MNRNLKLEITELLQDTYTTVDLLGQDLAATQHRVYYGLDEKVATETLETWKYDLRGVQKRLDEIFTLLEERPLDE